MTLEYLLLGMLAEPASGYELKQAFGETLRHFWDAELSQIYPALQRMERRGWLRSRMERSQRGPARRVYRRTAAGTKALRAWLKEKPEMPQPRLAYLGQLVFLHELGDLRLTRKLVEELRSSFAARLEGLRQVEGKWFASEPGWPDAMTDDSFHAHLTLRAGINRLEAAVAWCDESLARIDSRQNAGGEGRHQ